MTTKKALLIGINYKGTGSQLNGCLNDVDGMKKFLRGRGYVAKDITVITDETRVKPTRANIVAAFMGLLETGAPTLFFHYSGHGSHTIDCNYDENDAQDECLVPLDYDDSGMITDDQIAGMLSFIKPESKMIAILDCCHSGTGFDLCYSVTAFTPFVRKPNMKKFVMKQVGAYPNTSGQVVMISGCADSETSADAYIDKRYQGALTYSLLRSLNDASVKTWEELYTSVRKILQDEKYEQNPYLTSGRELDLGSEYYL